MIFKSPIGQKENDTRTQYLNRVLYALFHLDNLDEVKENRFMYNLFPQFVEYDAETQLTMIKSIKWALKQDNLKAVHSLPDLPFDSDFVRQYLTIVLGHFEKVLKT